MRTLYLVGYDIGANARRKRVLGSLRQHALGGQKSTYECRLDGAELQQLQQRLLPLLDQATDRLILLQLDPRAAVHTLGVAARANPSLFYQD